MGNTAVNKPVEEVISAAIVKAVDMGALYQKVDDHDRRIECIEKRGEATDEKIEGILLGQERHNGKLDTIIDKLAQNNSAKLMWKIAAFSASIGGAFAILTAVLSR